MSWENAETGLTRSLQLETNPLHQAYDSHDLGRTQGLAAKVLLFCCCSCARLASKQMSTHSHRLGTQQAMAQAAETRHTTGNAKHA